MATQHVTPSGAIANAHRPPDGVAGRRFARSRPDGVAVRWSHSDRGGHEKRDRLTAPAHPDHPGRAPVCGADSRSPGVLQPGRPRRDRSRSPRAAVHRCPGPVPKSPLCGARQPWRAGRSAPGVPAAASWLDQGSAEVPTARPFGGFVDRSSSDLFLGPAVVHDHEATVGKTRASGNRELRQSKVWRTTVAAGARHRAPG